MNTEPEKYCINCKHFRNDFPVYLVEPNERQEWMRDAVCVAHLKKTKCLVYGSNVYSNIKNPLEERASFRADSCQPVGKFFQKKTP